MNHKIFGEDEFENDYKDCQTKKNDNIEDEIEGNEAKNQEKIEKNSEFDEFEENSLQDEKVCEVVSEVENNTGNDYLDMARRVQADFDNFRRHATENIKKAKVDGQSSVIEVFLPCLDTFKEAKKSINDENVLKGVEMIENKINEALKELGVEKLESIGQVYDPHVHNVIAVMRDENKENDIILDEYQAGYKFNDKVLRYAKVIVNKL